MPSRNAMCTTGIPAVPSLGPLWLTSARHSSERGTKRVVARQRQGTTNRERDHPHMGTYPYGCLWEPADYGKNNIEQGGPFSGPSARLRTGVFA